MSYHYDFDDEDLRFFEQLKKELEEEQSLGTPAVEDLRETQEKFESLTLGYASLIAHLGDTLITLDEGERARVFHEVENWNYMLTNLETSKHDILRSIGEGHGLQGAFHLSNETIGVFYQTAKHLIGKGNYVDAKNLLALLVDLCPQISEFWIGMGLCHHSMGEDTKALQSYLHAGVASPEDPLPDLLAAESYLILGKEGEAKKHINLAKKKHEALPPNLIRDAQISELESKLQ